MLPFTKLCRAVEEKTIAAKYIEQEDAMDVKNHRSLNPIVAGTEKDPIEDVSESESPLV